MRTVERIQVIVNGKTVATVTNTHAAVLAGMRYQKRGKVTFNTVAVEVRK